MRRRRAAAGRPHRCRRRRRCRRTRCRRFRSCRRTNESSRRSARGTRGPSRARAARPRRSACCSDGGQPSAGGFARKYSNMNGTPGNTRAPNRRASAGNWCGTNDSRSTHRRALQQQRHHQVAEPVRVRQRNRRRSACPPAAICMAAMMWSPSATSCASVVSVAFGAGRSRRQLQDRGAGDSARGVVLMRGTAAARDQVDRRRTPLERWRQASSAGGAISRRPRRTGRRAPRNLRQRRPASTGIIGTSSARHASSRAMPPASCRRPRGRAVRARGRPGPADRHSAGVRPRRRRPSGAAPAGQVRIGRGGSSRR